jgi:hypothetical protein
MLSPWHQWLDPAKYNRHIDTVAALGASVVASAHGVALRGPQIAHVLDLLRGLPDMDAAPLPGQSDLELIIKSITEPPANAAA